MIKNIFFLVGVFFFVLPVKAHAYLDPGTGSYLLQMMAAGFFGALYLVSHWWKQIKHFFSNLFSRKDKKLSEKQSPKEK